MASLAARCQMALSSGLTALYLRSYWAWLRAHLVAVTGQEALFVFLLQVPTLVPLLLVLADTQVAVLRASVALFLHLGSKALRQAPLPAALPRWTTRAWEGLTRWLGLPYLGARLAGALPAWLSTPFAALRTGMASGFSAPPTPRVIHFTAVAPPVPVVVFPERRPPQPAASEDTACIVCLSHARAVCAVPCGHALFCYDCLARHVTTLRPACPSCNGPIREVIYVYH